MKSSLIRIPVGGLLLAALCTAVGIVCFASAPAVAGGYYSDGIWIPEGVCVDCGSTPNPGGGSNSSRPSQRDRENSERIDKANNLLRAAKAAASGNDAREALRLAREAQAMANDYKWLQNWVRQLEDHIAQEGLRQQAVAARKTADAVKVEADAAYNRGDLRAALALYRRALATDPDCLDEEGKKWVRDLEARLNAAGSMQQSISRFTQSLTAVQSSGGLDFDSTPGQARSASGLPSGDPTVVDARDVPSGLPKGLDDTIENAYSSAPPGVSDRVRKGFQAVMERDWKVAKAWFQEALKRDPTNVGLKRLVALTDSSPHVDTRNEPAGLGGTPDAKSAGKQASQAQPVSVSKADTNLQLPDPDDIRFLFPGLQKMKGGEAPVFTTLPDGRRVQMPQDSDMEYLFGPQAAPKATPTYIIGKNGQLVQVPENSEQKSATYKIGENGKLMELPQPKDGLIMFPETSPSSTPK